MDRQHQQRATQLVDILYITNTILNVLDNIPHSEPELRASWVAYVWTTVGVVSTNSVSEFMIRDTVKLFQDPMWPLVEMLHAEYLQQWDEWLDSTKKEDP